MNLRLDKVARVVAPGLKRVYSLVLSDEGLYLIQTGPAGALKHYRSNASGQLILDRPDDRSVKEVKANEHRLAVIPLDELAQVRDNFVIRLEAIEDVEVKSSKQEPEMWIGVTGSEHHLFFPFASLEEVETLQRALSKWITPR